MDAFYASVEQRDNPELRGKPLAVGHGDRRGVVAAASYEARQFGVRSALPSVTALRKCPELIFVPPRFEVYRAVSKQIHAIFADYTALIELLALDEAYLDVTANRAGLETAWQTAKAIRARVLDPDNPGPSFADRHRLFIEPRDVGTNLTRGMVFSFLVEKGVLRMGWDLRCPRCQLSKWTALDPLRQQHTCGYCGARYDSTRQLVESPMAFRRSGLLGIQRDAQGAIPVALVLQQLANNLGSLGREALFLPSIELADDGGGDFKCETDIFALFSQTYPPSARPTTRPDGGLPLALVTFECPVFARLKKQVPDRPDQARHGPTRWPPRSTDSPAS